METNSYDNAELVWADSGVKFLVPKYKGYWALDPKFKVYREHKPSLWKRFWVSFIFQVKWVDEKE